MAWNFKCLVETEWIFEVLDIFSYASVLAASRRTAALSSAPYSSPLPAVFEFSYIGRTDAITHTWRLILTVEDGLLPSACHTHIPKLIDLRPHQPAVSRWPLHSSRCCCLRMHAYINTFLSHSCGVNRILDPAVCLAVWLQITFECMMQQQMTSSPVISFNRFRPI